MKIAHIILTSQNGGAEQAFIDYSVALKNLGHEILAIIKNDAPYAAEVENLGITVKKVPNKLGFYDIFTVKKIHEILKEFNADAVIAHAGRSTVLARRAIVKIKNKKTFLIAVNHSMNVKRSIGADIILSVNKEIFLRTINAGQSETKSFVIQNAIDLSDAPKVASKIDLQNKETIILGGMGRLDIAKGFYFTIKAIKKLEDFTKANNLNKKFVFKLAGSGVQEDYLRNLVKELNIESQIEFLGWMKNKKGFFESIDIFVMSSERETFGLVVLEAMKFCKPIISTDADGPKEFLRNEIDALMVNLQPLESVENRIADAVLRMVSEPELADKLVANAFAKVNDKFSYKALEKYFEEIVGRVKS
jgi:glycosyltransferase involved in cell wall biosynthesis